MATDRRNVDDDWSSIAAKCITSSACGHQQSGGLYSMLIESGIWWPLLTIVQPGQPFTGLPNEHSPFRNRLTGRFAAKHFSLSLRCLLSLTKSVHLAKFSLLPLSWRPTLSALHHTAVKLIYCYQWTLNTIRTTIRR